MIYKNYAPPSRIDAPGVLHHIICRGIERRDIFHDEAGRKNSVDRLGDVLIMRTMRQMPVFGRDHSPSEM
ncbi:MAG: hypothetical protein E3J46_09120 [Desulfobacteraceae bacterium]|nr:MAG: hypothetical protein E3J46_09120 [Desulfobacteraceae bacterium]